MARITVSDLPHLKKLIAEGNKEFFITLSGGLISRKTINLTKDRLFKIKNRIDNTTITLTEEGVMDQNLTNVGRAIALNALICDL